MHWRQWWESCNDRWARSVRAAALFLIQVYRVNFSGLLGGICRFQPTCSTYAKECFETHPPLRAFWLTLRRLAKCHPLGPFGFDPVPERKSK